MRGCESISMAGRPDRQQQQSRDITKLGDVKDQ